MHQRRQGLITSRILLGAILECMQSNRAAVFGNCSAKGLIGRGLTIDKLGQAALELQNLRTKKNVHVMWCEHVRTFCRANIIYFLCSNNQ